MQLCKQLHSDLTLEESSQGIFNEIQFLMQRKGRGNQEKGIIKDIKVKLISELANIKFIIKCINQYLQETLLQARQKMNSVAHLNMRVIGHILRMLFTEKGYYISLVTTGSQLKSTTTSVATTPADTLFSVSNSGHSTLFYLVLTVFGRAPEPFEYIKCSPATTEEELKIFMKRILQHPGMYIILHVDCLPHFLQEVI